NPLETGDAGIRRRQPLNDAVFHSRNSETDHGFVLSSPCCENTDSATNRNASNPCLDFIFSIQAQCFPIFSADGLCLTGSNRPSRMRFRFALSSGGELLGIRDLVSAAQRDSATVSPDAMCCMANSGSA